MSYRAFKRLLGETSLERKCRFLLGTGILILITASFWLYARQTEHLAYDATTTTGRLLVPSIVARLHVESAQAQDALDEFQKLSEEYWPEALANYQYRLIKLNPTRSEHKPESDDLVVLKKFTAEGQERLQEESRLVPSRQSIFYYGAIRATASCVDCHNRLALKRGETPDIKSDDLLAVVAIRLPIKAIESGVHINRALLISTALVTALLIMAGSYLIIRYCVVKPVKHLKEVSDAISAGELNVRSEIQTGDEFEDLSHAFNRMLRNLVSMQDRLSKVNRDLDRKVDELASVNLALYESNKLKSDFLSTMSHELRTPLNSILGFSDVLLSTDLPEKQRRWIMNIQTSGKELLELITEVLDLAKMEAGKMQVHLEDVSINDLSEGLFKQFEPLAEKKNIEMQRRIDPNLGLLRQDPDKIRRILQNLISNAIKFTPEGGRILLKADPDGEFVLLAVSDTGVGIAPEDRDLIFEKFRQAANPMTRETGGTGLGLSIVRELTKLLGGEITLKSELGRGSTFTIRLPRSLERQPQLDLASVDGLPDLRPLLGLRGGAAML